MRPQAGAFGQQASVTLTEYSIWGAAAPGSATSEGTDVILGTKFRTDRSGEIRGIRWYRDTSTPGPASVALFQGTTNLSGTTTVSGQTASGWQRMNFATAVNISSSTIYIAAMLLNASGWNYRATTSYFTSATINGPLEAVANATSVNGVYIYSSTMTVPNQTFSSSCYFVDVIFAA
jgi:hypothetical protein